MLAVIGIVITQWDLLAAYYDKWTRPADCRRRGRVGDVEWFCPMHPSVVRDNPHDKCPICFMPLSKRKKGDEHEEALPAGVVNRVQLSPYRVVLAGVQTSKVDYQPLTQGDQGGRLRRVRRAWPANRRGADAGRIDKLFVNETGQMVDEGDELASLYSPDLIVTVENLLDAKRTKNERNLESSRRRLELLGIDDDQIDEILASGKANTHLIIRSPITGHVIKKYVREGQYVEEGNAAVRHRRPVDRLDSGPGLRRRSGVPAGRSVAQANRRRGRAIAGRRHDAGVCRRAVLRHAGVHLSPRRSKRRGRCRSASSWRIPATSCGRAARPRSTIKVPPQKLPMFARIAEAGGDAGRNAGRRPGAGGARNVGDRHGQPDDRLSRNDARRVRRGASETGAADVGTARRSLVSGAVGPQCRATKW